MCGLLLYDEYRLDNDDDDHHHHQTFLPALHSNGDLRNCTLKGMLSMFPKCSKFPSDSHSIYVKLH
jgi:hypothetical protein